MLNTIKGVYDKGKITLAEEPPVKTKADVIVTFLNGENGEIKEKKRKLGGLEGKVMLPDDFNEPLDDLIDYM
jgi:Protein of unknown function (DUF2281)